VALSTRPSRMAGFSPDEREAGSTWRPVGARARGSGVRGALDKAERVSDSPVGFHAQQALKAVLASRDLEFPFTHDLGVLMQLCEDAGFELPADLAEADRLTPYAAALRYGLGNPEAVPAGRALHWAAIAVEWADAEIRSAS
jgi:HEPN domain-containing protein